MRLTQIRRRTRRTLTQIRRRTFFLLMNDEFASRAPEG
jgi:hypothetical protein